MQRNKGKNKFIHRRRKNPSIKPGMQLGHLYIRQRVRTPSGSSGGQRWLVDCGACGKTVTIPQFYMIRKDYPKRDCGCVPKTVTNPYSRERGIWYMMHRRCYNSDHVAFKHYGGANPPITVCPEWNMHTQDRAEAFAHFIKDMGPAPSKKHTLDRIDPYKGYGWQLNEQGERYLNCRWATSSEQMNNLKRHWLSPAERKALAEQEAAEVGDGEDEGDDEEGEDDGQD